MRNKDLEVPPPEEASSTAHQIVLEEQLYGVDDEHQSAVIALSLTPRHATIGTDRTETTSTLICASMRARSLPEETKRASVDIMVALDVSGSMQGDKLALCKKTLELLLRQCGELDRFGLVSYSDDAVTEIPMTPMTPANRDAAWHKIQGLRVDNSTNLSAAIALAFHELRAVEQPNEVRSVFLLTDGLANSGICHHADLVDFTKNCARPPVAKLNDAVSGRPNHPLRNFYWGRKKTPTANSASSDKASCSINETACSIDEAHARSSALATGVTTTRHCSETFPRLPGVAATTTSKMTAMWVRRSATRWVVCCRSRSRALY